MYYIEFESSVFSTEDFALRFRNSRFDYNEIMSDLEKINSGIILIFQDDASHNLVYNRTRRTLVAIGLGDMPSAVQEARMDALTRLER